MKPEEGEPQNIDKQLTQTGWILQEYKNINHSSGLGIEICECPTKSGMVDYSFFILFFNPVKFHSDIRNYIVKIISFKWDSMNNIIIIINENNY